MSKEDKEERMSKKEPKKPSGDELLERGEEGRKEYIRICEEIRQRVNELMKFIDPYVERRYALRREVYNELIGIYSEWDRAMELSPERAVKEFIREDIVKSAVESFELYTDDRKAFVENYYRKLEAIMEEYLRHVRRKFFTNYKDRVEKAMDSLIWEIFHALEELKKIEFERKRKAEIESQSSKLKNSLQEPAR